ncbi:MAG: hypothetical protein H8E66_20085 [Planctomycetes bacterium]|nr:hypothetical protein [Planctomycetota bacterium]
MQRITQIGILSFAKIMGLIGFFGGLLIGIPYGLMLMILGAGIGANAEQGGAGVTVFGVGGGLVMMFALPLVYAALSFLVGLIYGLIINLVLHLSGGLQLRIEAPRYAEAIK